VADAGNPLQGDSKGLCRLIWNKGPETNSRSKL